MIKQQLQDDIKAAMLAKDTLRIETLRGLKSVILYAEVAAMKREGDGFSDESRTIRPSFLMGENKAERGPITTSGSVAASMLYQASRLAATVIAE